MGNDYRPHLTGRTRYRVMTTWWQRSVIVLQVEVVQLREGGVDDEGTSYPDYLVYKWRDASTEDLTEGRRAHQ